MSAPKTTTFYALLLKPEASYAAGATVTASADAIMLAEEVVATPKFLNDGSRASNPGNAGKRKPAKPSGKYAEFDAKVEARGAGVAYTASVKSNDLHNLLLAAGHSATVDTTAGSQKWTFAPISTGYTSLGGEGYARGQKTVVSALYASGVKIEAKATEIITVTFPCKALLGALTDTAVPTPTYQTTDPIKAESMACTINGVTLVLREVSFDGTRELHDRADANAAVAHAGWTPGDRNPTTKIVVEAVPLATLNPYALREAATSMAFAWTAGPAQFNRLAFNSAQSVIAADIVDGADGATATWEITMTHYPSTPVANDDYTIALT